MLKFLPVLLFSFTSICCWSQEDCLRFRSGKFAFRDSAGVVHQIQRTKTHQTEFNPQTKLKVKFRIEWSGKCEYKLTQVWASTSEKRKMNRSWQTYQIISSTENTYEFSCSCSNDKKITGVVLKTDWFE